MANLVVAAVLSSAGLASADKPPHADPAASPPHALRVPATRKATPPAQDVRPVDINSASRAELMTLPGIDEHRARLIIATRPYLSKAELVTKQVLPAGPYQSLRHRIVALQTAKRSLQSRTPLARDAQAAAR